VLVYCLLVLAAAVARAQSASGSTQAEHLAARQLEPQASSPPRASKSMGEAQAGAAFAHTISEAMFWTSNSMGEAQVGVAATNPAAGFAKLEEQGSASLEALQAQWMALKGRIAQHRGTVLVTEVETKNVSQYISDNSLSQPNVLRVQTVMRFKISKVESGPMIHDPNKQYTMAGREQIGYAPHGLGPSGSGFPGLNIETNGSFRLNYSLHIENEALQYRFSIGTRD
jgi:hypothetical protein